MTDDILSKMHWRDRHDAKVAEVAETLGVPTDHVFASVPLGRTQVVFYRQDERVMLRVTLRRDTSGMLVRDGEPVEVDGDALIADPTRIGEFIE